MKVLPAALALFAVTATIGLPAASFAQAKPGPATHEPVQATPMQNGPMGQTGKSPGMTPTGNARTGQMHHHGYSHGYRHGGHRHCWVKWHHHHRVRTCR
jgi:hypothetical protein